MDYSLLIYVLPIVIATYYYFCDATGSQDISTIAINSDPKLLNTIEELVKASGDKNIVQKVKKALKKLKIALLVVDYQNDFVTGSLPIAEGDAKEDPHISVKKANELVEAKFDEIVLTQDWHPANHISFIDHANDSDRTLGQKHKAHKLNLFEPVEFVEPNKIQVLYPSHCVENTEGAEFIPELIIPPSAIIVQKGMDTLIDSYSAFMDNDGEKKSELDEVLHQLDVDAVVSCGVAYDICVFHTTKDAHKLKYLAATARDAGAALLKDGIDNAHAHYKKEKIAVLTAEEAVQMVETREKFPLEWIYHTLQKIVHE